MEIQNNIFNIYKPSFCRLKQPKRLEQVLLEKNVDGKKFEMEDFFVKKILKNKELASTPIVDLCGFGSSAVAFETADEKVLKFTEGSHFPFGRPRESFDVPIYKEGKIKRIHYYLEEKLYQHGLTDGFISIIKDEIRQKGYRVSDLGSNDIQQIGMSKSGKLYLLDPECARCKTIFHAIWNKITTKLMLINSLKNI